MGVHKASRGRVGPLPWKDKVSASCRVRRKEVTEDLSECPSLSWCGEEEPCAVKGDWPVPKESSLALS